MPQPFIDGIKLCSVADVRNLSTINPAYDGRNDSIESFIRAASEQIISYCNRTLIKQMTVSEYFDTQETDGCSSPYRIYLKEPNVTNFRLWLSYRNVFNNDTLQTVDDSYFLEPYGPVGLFSRLYLRGCLRQWRRAVKVTYDSGFPVDADDDNLYTSPRAVRQATALQAGFLMSRAAVEDIGTGDLNRQTRRRDPRIRPDGVTPEAAHLLRDYRRNLTGST